MKNEMKKLISLVLIPFGLIQSFPISKNTSSLIHSLPNGTLVKSAGSLYFSDTDAGNSADTNYVISDVYALPANSLSTDGDRLEIDAVITTTATAASKQATINIGYTSFAVASNFTGGITVYNNTFSAVSDTLHIHGIVTRQSATTASVVAPAILVASAVVRTGGVYQTGASITWANANNIAVSIQSSVGTANIGIIREFKVTYFPK